MGILEDIRNLTSYVKDNLSWVKEHKIVEIAKRVDDWLESPSCPLTED